MKIYLYLKSKILTFSIPQKIIGSYSFDEKQDERSKLINIEARDGQWYIYSTTDVSVTSGGGPSISLPVTSNSFYVLKRAGIEYLVYITEPFDDTFQAYKYNEKLNLVIGNDRRANINYSCSYIKGIVAKVSFNKNRLLLDVLGNGVYLNNVVLDPSKQSYMISSGDQINIYGLKMVFLNGFFMLNNPGGNLKKDLLSCKLSPYQISSGEQIVSVDFKDTDLYTKEQYFSKSPRLRRIIKTRNITLSEPPENNVDKELPEILTVGPMLTMGVIYGVTLFQTVLRILTGESSLKQSFTQLITSSLMLVSMIFWPIVTEKYNKRLNNKRRKKAVKKYMKYLNLQKEELDAEVKLQKEILIENLVSTAKCIEIIGQGQSKLWDKRVDQNDFLVVKLGNGNEKLSVNIEFPEKGFSIEEDELRKKADALVEEYKYIKDVPIGYSFYNNRITGIIGLNYKRYGMIRNIILQLITFYSYEDIKLVIFTSKLYEQYWEFVKYLNHNLSNDRSIRFFSTDVDSAKKVCEYINMEFSVRKMSAGKEEVADDESNSINNYKPYYVIITDNYSQIRRENVIKNLCEEDRNFGFSFIILEDQMNRLPSKCSDFINLEKDSSSILKDSFDNQERTVFKEEIEYGIDMMTIARRLSNIPIEFENGNRQLPDSLSFLEMEMVGKVEQLNILNRWETCDPSTSLKAEIGVDQDGNTLYLDLHEKYHGPHGLIAGTTGSGKSEFIITYILSMAMNYGPDDVAFILIDYKGGGLAFAFENKSTGISLPHLAGTITNLDKAEMNRTLVSIDSEVKKRQMMFNQARDALGESTIDIYKYQRYYKEGRIKDPIPHLFIICDEFAELKSQQPDFMDNLISVARIGRSLGVHLILATQKPSGVVNDQIWSNTKFRVCLKVQDEADSREMLKRPEAAMIKQAGRFYLQVGYDELFVLGQSGWCGAKYYPSEKIVKQIDKSVNFIDDVGNVIKRIQLENNIKIQAQGEQLPAILNVIVEVAKATGKYTRKLWLENVGSVILVDNITRKYKIPYVAYDVTAVLGEYDAPEKQEQGVVLYSLKTHGNTAIIGNDEVEREKLLIAMIYSIVTRFTPKEINIYIVDYGSEQLRVFNNFPQIGGMVFEGEDEKFKNLFKLVSQEVRNRKKALIPYRGSIELYIRSSENKLCQILVIINNYENLLEEYDMVYEDIASITRECERYGIYFVISFNNGSSLSRKIGQSITNRYALHMSESFSYSDVFDIRSHISPRDNVGRGVVNIDGLHEFQTAFVIEDEKEFNSQITELCNKILGLTNDRAKIIPHLPDKITFDIIQKEISTIDKVPIGIYKDSLEISKYNFKQNIATLISASKFNNINNFMLSLLDVLINIPNICIVFIDPGNFLMDANKMSNVNKVNYYNDKFDDLIDKFIDVQKKNINNRFIYILYGIDKLLGKISSDKLSNLVDCITTCENGNLIICDGDKQLKEISYDMWFSKIKSDSDGIWVGNGYAEQNLFRSDVTMQERRIKLTNKYGYLVSDGNHYLVKFIDFNDDSKDGEADE